MQNEHLTTELLGGVLIKSFLLITSRDLTSLGTVCRHWWKTLTSPKIRGEYFYHNSSLE